MSMYSLVHGKNPAAEWLLSLLELTPARVGRFRDCWVNHNGDAYEIAVYTRNGGGNRTCLRAWEEWKGGDPDPSGPASEPCNDAGCYGCIISHRLPKHPLYLRDADDGFDSTYATIFFRVPDEARPLVATLVENRDPDKTWLDAIEAMKNGQRPDIEARMKPLIDKLAELVTDAKRDESSR